MRKYYLGFVIFGVLLTGASAQQPTLIVLKSADAVFDSIPWTQAVATDANGVQRFYLLSRFTHTLAVYDDGHKPARLTRFFTNTPDALAVDTEGRMYLADSVSSQIQILSSTGQLLSKVPVRHHHPTSLAVLSDGNIVVASPMMNGTLLHIFDSSGRELMGFGNVKRFDADNDEENRFLNRGRVLVDPSGAITYVFQYAPTPTVQKYSSQGQLLLEFPVEGAAIELQLEAAHRFLREKDSHLIGGISVITSATIDPKTGHLWIGMNGSSGSGVVYEYDARGQKLHEYAFLLAEKRAQIITDVRELMVLTPSVYVFSERGAYRFEVNGSVPGSVAVAPPGGGTVQNQCPPQQSWPACSTQCADGSSVDCKQALMSQIADGLRVIGSTCSSDQNGCQATVTTCNTTNGQQVTHSTNLSCPPSSCDPSSCPPAPNPGGVT